MGPYIRNRGVLCLRFSLSGTVAAASSFVTHYLGVNLSDAIHASYRWTHVRGIINEMVVVGI